VLEVGRDGTVAWQVEGVLHSYAAERIRDGTTMVMLQQQSLARRFDHAGAVVDDRKLEGQVSCLLPVPGGWLHSGRAFVRRLGADDQELWRFKTGGWVGRVTAR
jgi:hypothetical protein